MNDLLGTLPGTLDFVWGALAQGVADGAAPCRFGVLATVGDGGEARMVVLRDADRVTGTAEVHSDTAAAKVAQLLAQPRASLVFWLPGAQVQIRLGVVFEILTGGAVTQRWQAIPAGPRRAYGGTPAPGQPITSPENHDPTPQQDRFAVLIGTVNTIETLHLGTPHRRALFRRDTGFSGGWIAP